MKMKLHLVLFVTAVLAASAVQARFSLNEDVLRKLSMQMMQDESKKVDVNRGVVATRTNGTLESIMEQLVSNKRYDVVYMHACTIYILDLMHVSAAVHVGSTMHACMSILI